MKTKRSVALTALVAALLIGAGCASSHPPIPTEGPLLPMTPPAPLPNTQASEGSLWSGSDSWSLFTDDKAHRAGDLVLVYVVEDSRAEKSSTTEIGRDSNIKAGISNFFGQEAKYGAGRLATGRDQDINLENLINATSQAEFKSDASVEQSGKVLANVMAQVIERRADGNLRIFGSQVVTINSEDQVVTISGLIRPSDIAPDNSIESPLIADARILYSGRGPSSNSTRPGWMFKLYYALWPF